MAKSTRRLGRGLDSLISKLPADEAPDAPTAAAREPRPLVDAPAATDETGMAASDTVEAAMLPIDQLSPNPYQPRGKSYAEDVTSLARSIQQSGMLQPIVVRRVAGRYEIIAGERRWAAARSISMSRVPVIVRQATDEQMLELALIENIQREDLNAIDRAKAYRQFCQTFGLKPDEVAERVGEDRSTVVNYLRLLELSGPIQGLVARRKLSMGHARCLLGVAQEQRRLQLADSVAENELSVRALEEIVRRERTRGGEDAAQGPRREAARSAHVLDLQQRFEQAVKTKVLIQEGKRKGTGRIVLEYYSLDDFDRIAEMLGVTPD